MRTDDIYLLREFLEATKPERRRAAEMLRRLLERQATTHPLSRQAVPCTRPGGLFVLLPWRMAAWLADALER